MHATVTVGSILAIVAVTVTAAVDVTVADAIAGSAVVIAAVVVVVPGSTYEAGSGCESKLGSRCGFGFNFRSGS